MRKVVFLIFIFLVPQLFASEKLATIYRETTLFSKPFKDADAITELETQTQITILKRKGGWYHIKTEGQQGWVRLTHVRLIRNKNSEQESDESVGDALVDLATGRDKSNEVTTATAVKGLSEEEIENAEPDEEALNALDSFASNESSSESGLQTRQIDYLAGDGPTETPAANAEEEE